MNRLNSKILTVTALLSFSLFFSCKKEHKHEEAVPDVDIIISAPLEAHEYDKGDTVFMNIKINASAELHGYEIHLYRLADTSVVFTMDKDEHMSTFDLHEFWVNDGKLHSDMELEVKAVYDHEGNSKSKKVTFHCHDQ